MRSHVPEFFPHSTHTLAMMVELKLVELGTITLGEVGDSFECSNPNFFLFPE